MPLTYLYDCGLDSTDLDVLKENSSEETYSEFCLFQGIVSENINYMKSFGVSNYVQVVVKYPDIFLRDAESFKNVFSKFDKDDLIAKVAKNPAVFKKMVEFVDNN